MPSQGAHQLHRAREEDLARQCFWFGPTSSSGRDRNNLRIGEVFDLPMKISPRSLSSASGFDLMLEPQTFTMLRGRPVRRVPRSVHEESKVRERHSLRRPCSAPRWSCSRSCNTRNCANTVGR